ncbi:MAG: patatin-like phospholipase family protein [Brevinematia bacterium]
MILRKKKIGVALGSGSFKGLCHLGFIKALEERGIIPDVIAGSSIGALIGALWASGLRSSEIIEVFKKINSRNFLKYISFSLSRKGFVETKVEDFLKECIGRVRFSELKTKLIVTATDITNAKRLAISEGNVEEAVRKSISVPGVIKPILENGSVIIDGGVLAPLPIKELVEEGCSEIFASSLVPKNFAHILPTVFERFSKTAREKIEEIFKIELPEPSLTVYSIVKRSLVVMNIFLEEYEIALYKPKLVVRYDIEDLDISALDRIQYYIDLSYKETLKSKL